MSHLKNMMNPFNDTNKERAAIDIFLQGITGVLEQLEYLGTREDVPNQLVIQKLDEISAKVEALRSIREPYAYN